MKTIELLQVWNKSTLVQIWIPIYLVARLSGGERWTRRHPWCPLGAQWALLSYPQGFHLHFPNHSDLLRSCDKQALMFSFGRSGVYQLQERETCWRVRGHLEQPWRHGASPLGRPEAAAPPSLPPLTPHFSQPPPQQLHPLSIFQVLHFFNTHDFNESFCTYKEKSIDNINNDKLLGTEPHI